MLGISLVETAFDGRLEIRRTRGYARSGIWPVRDLPRSGSVQQLNKADPKSARRALRIW
jgi:hypothetical protein